MLNLINLIRVSLNATNEVVVEYVQNGVHIELIPDTTRAGSASVLPSVLPTPNEKNKPLLNNCISDINNDYSVEKCLKIMNCYNKTGLTCLIPFINELYELAVKKNSSVFNVKMGDYVDPNKRNAFKLMKVFYFFGSATNMVQTIEKNKEGFEMILENVTLDKAMYNDQLDFVYKCENDMMKKAFSLSFFILHDNKIYKINVIFDDGVFTDDNSKEIAKTCLEVNITQDLKLNFIPKDPGFMKKIKIVMVVEITPSSEKELKNLNLEYSSYNEYMGVTPKGNFVQEPAPTTIDQTQTESVNQPQTEKKKVVNTKQTKGMTKTKKIVIIILICTAVFIILGCVAAFFFMKSNKPTFSEFEVDGLLEYNDGNKDAKQLDHEGKNNNLSEKDSISVIL